MKTLPGIVTAAAIAAFVMGCASQDRPDADVAYRPAREQYRQKHPPRRNGAIPGADPVELNERCGLGGMLVFAARNNPGLEAAFNRWKAAVQRVPQVRALPDPQLSYRYYLREVETRVGAMRQGASLSQTFPWLGKLRLRGDAAAAGAEAARYRFEAARLELFYRVRHAFYEYAHLSRRIEILERNLQLLRRVEQVARTRYRAAAASHPDLIRAQVELGKLEDRLQGLRELRGPLAADLNAAMNRPLEAELPPPAEIPETSYDADDEQLLLRLSSDNPELKALEAETEAARCNLDLARQAYIPDVTLGVDYTDVAEPIGARRPSDAGKDALAVRATINLPVWLGRLAAGVREARSRMHAADQDRRQRENDLGARLKRVLYHFRDAERKLALYRDALLPKARQAVKSSEAAFRAARASFTDLLDAERVLLEFELSAARARTDRAQRLAEIQMLVGSDVLDGPPASPAASPGPGEIR
jgi:outer membrane protein TolC